MNIKESIHLSQFPYSLSSPLSYMVSLNFLIFVLLYLKFQFPFFQWIPIWWRWYYWANPVAWSLYGLLTSQYGDNDNLVKLSDGINTVPINRLLREVFGFRHDFLVISGFMVVSFCLMFAVIFAYAIKSFNFQKR